VKIQPLTDDILALQHAQNHSFVKPQDNEIKISILKYTDTVYIKSFEGENFHGSSIKLNM